MSDQWEPKIVRERLVEAVRWARYNAGQTGPSGIRSCMPAYVAGLEDHLESGWGLPETADPKEEKTLRVNLAPAKVTQILASLEWCAEYLRDHQGSAVWLNVWLRCKVYGGDFNRVAAARGVSRAHAYRLRDRGLSLIAQGLDSKGVPL